MSSLASARHSATVSGAMIAAVRPSRAKARAAGLPPRRARSTAPLLSALRRSRPRASRGGGGRDERGRPAGGGEGEGGGTARSTRQLDRLLAECVAAIRVGVVSKSAREAGNEPRPQLDLVGRKPFEGLLEQRHEPRVDAGTGVHALPAVAGRRARELPRQVEAPRDLGGLEEDLLRRRPVTRALGLAEREQKLAPRLLVRRVRPIKCLERGAVLSRGFLVREELEGVVT